MTRFLRLIGVGALMFSGFKYVAAQYGVPTDMEMFGRRSNFVKFVSENNEPIKGLEISLIKNKDTTVKHSDDEGIVRFTVSKHTKRMRIIIKDKDGKERKGFFFDKDTVLDNRQKKFKIVMKRKDG